MEKVEIRSHDDRRMVFSQEGMQGGMNESAAAARVDNSFSIESGALLSVTGNSVRSELRELNMAANGETDRHNCS